MVLLRWSSEAARELYARMSEQTAVALLDSGAEAAFNTIRSHTLVATGAAAHTAMGSAAEQVEGRQLDERAGWVDKVTADGAVPVARAEALLSQMSIDEDGILEGVHENMDALQNSAARMDVEAGVSGAPDSDDEEG